MDEITIRVNSAWKRKDTDQSGARTLAETLGSCRTTRHSHCSWSTTNCLFASHMCS